MVDDKAVSDLVISYLFPPDFDVSSVVVCKRIIGANKKVDVICSPQNVDDVELEECVSDYVARKIELDLSSKRDTEKGIYEYLEKGMAAIDKKYENIYSRSWLMSNHFLAMEYKFANPDVFWTAEISDPIILNTDNTERIVKSKTIHDSSYIDKLNGEIKKFNSKNSTDFPLLEAPCSAFFITEYMLYLFADKIRFMNKNQREIMLNHFPYDVNDFVLEKSEIASHPTFAEEYYHLHECDVDLNDGDINIAYFGNYYYAMRHFEPIFYAISSLNHKFRDKIKLHLYLDDELIFDVVRNLDLDDNIVIKKPLEYFDFLNATTKYDILLVNDSMTRMHFDKNPYLPSKISDYLGSGTDIWALYEKGSSLSALDFKYTSDVNDYDACRETLIEILNEYGFGDENLTFNNDYFDKRLTTLNLIIEEKYKELKSQKKKNKKLKKKNKKLKKKLEKSEIPSDSSKVTKAFRKLKNNYLK